VHHGSWYSAKFDAYIQIPEAELEAKRQLVKRNQAHRKFRRDPADRVNPTDRQNRPLEDDAWERVSAIRR